MSVDVEIYMNNLMKFFRDNPKELLSLIPQEKEQEFYQKIRLTAFQNHEKGEEITLTQKQLLDICRELNAQTIEIDKKLTEVIVNTPFGSYSLN